MILQSNGLHITLIADDMHPLDTTIDAIFTEICTAYQDQMPILAATIKQVLKKNPVANTVSASLPGTVTGELLVADSINVLDTFSNLDDKIRYLASCYKSDLTMRHSSCQENFKNILGSLSFIKFFPELKELSEDDYQYFLSFVDDIFYTYWVLQLHRAFEIPVKYEEIPYLHGSPKSNQGVAKFKNLLITNLSDFGTRQFAFSFSPIDLSFQYEINYFDDFIYLLLVLYLKNADKSNLLICPVCGKFTTRSRKDAICCCSEHATQFKKLRDTILLGDKDTLLRVWTRARKRNNKMANEYDWPTAYDNWYSNARAIYATAKTATWKPAVLDQKLNELWENQTKGLPKK